MRNKKTTKGKVRIFSPSEFLPAFLKYEIFDYFFWSCGMVKREIVEKVGKAHPLNESNLLTDYAYILRVGTAATMVTINHEIGTQRIHGSNYGRNNSDLLTLKPAVEGLYKEVVKQAKYYNCGKELEKFLTNWVRDHLLSILKFRRIKYIPEERNFFVILYSDIMRDFTFFQPGFLAFCFRIYFPQEAGFYDKNKWIFEKRTIQKGIIKYILRKLF